MKAIVDESEDRAMPVSEATYEQVALEDPEGQWELVCGRLRRKPQGMTTEHYGIMRRLDRQLWLQLDPEEYQVCTNSTRLRTLDGTDYIPDLFIIPQVLEAQNLEEAATQLEVYRVPVPLVVEVWSPSTGDYDVEVKLREYQRRGDLEIWRIHPRERTLTTWRRQPDGSYAESLHRAGTVQPVALPEVTIDLEGLFPRRA